MGDVMGKTVFRGVLKSLSDLKDVQKTLEDEINKKALQKEIIKKKAQQASNERELFIQSVGAVVPMKTNNRVLHAPMRRDVTVMQHTLDEQKVMQDALSDKFDYATLLATDEELSYRAAGIGADVLIKLRRGQWSIQAQLDLHGLRSEDARSALNQFILQSYKKGLRCVRIIHGKGLGSIGKVPILKNKTYNWLVQKEEVIALVQAKPADGGAGALVVLLAPNTMRV